MVVSKRRPELTAVYVGLYPYDRGSGHTVAPFVVAVSTKVGLVPITCSSVARCISFDRLALFRTNIWTKAKRRAYPVKRDSSFVDNRYEQEISIGGVSRK